MKMCAEPRKYPDINYGVGVGAGVVTDVGISPMEASVSTVSVLDESLIPKYAISSFFAMTDVCAPYSPFSTTNAIAT